MKLSSLLEAILGDTKKRAIGIMWLISSIVFSININILVACIGLILINVLYAIYLGLNIHSQLVWEKNKREMTDVFYANQFYQLAVEHNIEIVYSADGNLEIHGDPEDVNKFCKAADLSFNASDIEFQ